MICFIPIVQINEFTWLSLSFDAKPNACLNLSNLLNPLGPFVWLHEVKLSGSDVW